MTAFMDIARFSLFFLLLFLWMLPDAASQQAPSDAFARTAYSQEFQFRPGVQQGSVQVANALLQLASEGGQKLRVYTAYRFMANVEANLSLSENQLIVHIRNVALGGDTHYRDFSLHQWMIPALLDFDIEMEKAGANQKQVFAFRDVVWNTDVTTDTLLIFPLQGLRINGTTKLNLNNIRFHYPESHYDTVAALIPALDSYYQAPEMMTRAELLMQGLKSTQPEHVILEEFRLCEAEVIAGKIAHAPFWEFLRTTGSDPLSMASAFNVLQREINSLRNDFNFRIAHIDSLMYQRGLQLMEEQGFLAARSIFERVLGFNPLHIPSHVMLAEFDLQAGNAVAVMTRLKGLLGRAEPPAQWHYELMQMTRKLFDTEIGRAAEFADDGRFLDARHVLENLEVFCDDITQWQCPVQLQESLSKVHYGMYRSYLLVARRAYENNNFPFAVTYAGSALEYQQANSKYVFNDSEVMELLQKVLDGYMLTASQAKVFNDFALAVRSLEQAVALCRQYAQLQCSTGLSDQLAQAREKKEQSDKMLVEYMIVQPEITRPGLSAQQIMQLVREKLSLGHLKAWAGETPEARLLLNEITEYSLRFGLRQDTLINTRILSLTQMIKDKECELDHRDLRILLEGIKEKLGREFYDDAYQDYQHALSLQQKTLHCDEDFSAEIDALAYVKLLGQYQQLIHEAQTAYFRGAEFGFDIFIGKYTRAEEFLLQHDLEQWGVKHTSLLDFILNSSNTGLVKASVAYYAQSNEHENALRLLGLLMENRLDPREVRDLQEFAGQRAARFISTHNPEVQPRIYVHEITGNDAWYRYYVRSFISSWGN